MLVHGNTLSAQGQVDIWDSIYIQGILRICAMVLKKALFILPFTGDGHALINRDYCTICTTAILSISTTGWVTQEGRPNNEGDGEPLLWTSCKKHLDCIHFEQQDFCKLFAIEYLCM